MSTLATFTKAVSANAYKTSKSTVILGATSTAGGVNTALLTIQNSAQRGGSKGAMPVVSTVRGTKKAYSSGTFAYQAANKWVVLGGNVTATISGVANTVLASGAANFGRRSIHSKTTYRTSFLTNLAWASDLAFPTYTFTVSAQNPSFGADNAVTMAELSFMQGSTTPYNADYKTRTW